MSPPSASLNGPLLRRLSWVLLAVPGAWLGWDAWQGALGSRPLTAAITETGLWSMRLLLGSLMISPAIRIFGWSALNAVRRAIGLGALAYALAHLGFHLWDQAFDWPAIAWDILVRLFLEVGTVALLAMVALGAISNGWATRRLGAARALAIHRLAQPILLLVLFHALLVHHGVEAMALIGGTIWLMLWRQLPARGWADNPAVLVGLALLCGGLSALVEAGWYAATSFIDPWRVLATNLDLGSGPRVSWWVAGAGLMVAVGALLARLPRPGRAQAPALEVR